LYATLQNGRVFSNKVLLIWGWISIYQGFVVIVLSQLLFPESFANLQTITFSSLIVLELFNYVTFVRSYKFTMIFASVLTIFIYILTIVLLPGQFDVSYFTWANFVRSMLLVAVAWLPIHIPYTVAQRLNPSESRKV